MSSQPAGAAQVEKVLDDLIARLSKGDSTKEVRAALIEARRLRNVTLRWAAIPPPPDARREMMSRVMDLVAQAGVAGRTSRPPAAPSVPPPRESKPRTEAEPQSPQRVAIETRSAPPPASFRANPAMEMTRPRPANGATKPRPSTGDDFLELDQVAPPRASAAPAVDIKRNAPTSRSLSPVPVSKAETVRQPSPMPLVRSAVPAASPREQRSVSPMPARNLSPIPGPSLSPLPGAKASGLRMPTPAQPVPKKRSTEQGLRPVGETRDAAPVSNRTPSEPAHKKAPTLEFEAPAKPEAPARPAPSARPVVRPSQPPTPRVPDGLRSRSPMRAHTIAGIPEANEAMLDALRRKSASAPPQEEPAPRSSRPTAAPPPNAGGSNAPPPLRKSVPKGTLMMGAVNAADAIEALRGNRAPSFDQDDFEGLPPITKPSSPRIPITHDEEDTVEAPRSRTGAPSPAPIRAVNAPSHARMEGLSSAVSVPAMPAVRPVVQRTPSSPTQIMGTPPPPSAAPGPSSQRPGPTGERPLRTVVAPGVTIVRPEASQWQPHPVAPGVTIKLLFRDARSGVYTALVRLGPGSSIGRRRHTAAEEMLLVSGIATIGHVEMRAGEYCRAEAETVHDRITTTTGCTFFLCGSEHDEFLDDE